MQSELKFNRFYWGLSMHIIIIKYYCVHSELKIGLKPNIHQNDIKTSSNSKAMIIFLCNKLKKTLSKMQGLKNRIHAGS